MTNYLYSSDTLSDYERLDYVSYIEAELRERTMLQVLCDNHDSAQNLAHVISMRYPDNRIYSVHVCDCQVTFRSVELDACPPLLCVVSVSGATVK